MLLNGHFIGNCIISTKSYLCLCVWGGGGGFGGCSDGVCPQNLLYGLFINFSCTWIRPPV